MYCILLFFNICDDFSLFFYNYEFEFPLIYFMYFTYCLYILSHVPWFERTFMGTIIFTDKLSNGMSLSKNHDCLLFDIHLIGVPNNLQSIEMISVSLNSLLKLQQVNYRTIKKLLQLCQMYKNNGVLVTYCCILYNQTDAQLWKSFNCHSGDNRRVPFVYFIIILWVEKHEW